MIKCNVNVTGTVSREMALRTSKEGNPYYSFAVDVVIPARSGINKTMSVSVMMDAGQQDLAMAYPVGTRVEMSGVLMFRKKGEALYLNFSASTITRENVGADDSIKGDMEFRGTLGGKMEEHNDKKGNPFSVFSAFSSEKTGQDAQGNPTFDFTWVRFLQFGSVLQSWMQPKVGIHAKGELELSVYNDHMDITCRVSELTQWEKSNG